jgi:hypothetical protein
MPPRRSARVADAIERETSALSPLPPALVHAILLLLPVDARARCACVCRGWRAAVAERSLWTCLDVSPTSGVAIAVTDALLRAAAARAGGELQTLDVWLALEVTREALLAVVTANGRTLRELRLGNGVCRRTGNYFGRLPDVVHVEALLRAAPQMRVLDVVVGSKNVADARRVLRAEGLLSPLRVRGLRVFGQIADDEAGVLTLAADAASHAWLQELCLLAAVPTPAALDALVDAALARRLTAVEFSNCRLSAASAPALARLLAGNAMTELRIWGLHHALLDAPAAALLAGTLQVNTTLTVLHVRGVQLWANAAAASTLLGALTAHPSLRELSLSNNINMHPATNAVVGAALGALLAANAPTLAELDIGYCGLGDAGMAPLFEALPRNTHLRTLCVAHTGMSEAFARTSCCQRCAPTQACVCCARIRPGLEKSRPRTS